MPRRTATTCPLRRRRGSGDDSSAPSSGARHHVSCRCRRRRSPPRRRSEEAAPEDLKTLLASATPAASSTDRSREPDDRKSPLPRSGIPLPFRRCNRPTRLVSGTADTSSGSSSPSRGRRRRGRSLRTRCIRGFDLGSGGRSRRSPLHRRCCRLASSPDWRR